MSDRYILNANHEPVPEPDLITWAQWLETAERRVAKDEIGASKVSTVFLGLDHRFGIPGAPVLFETMVFGGPLNDRTERYCTWDEALAGHAAICAEVRKANAQQEVQL